MCCNSNSQNTKDSCVLSGTFSSIELPLLVGKVHNVHTDKPIIFFFNFEATIKSNYFFNIFETFN